MNQRFFAQQTLRRKYGDWFETEWRKKFKTISDAEWKRAYDEAWKHRKNDCVEQSDEALFLQAIGEAGTILDVGCGQGSLAIRIAREGFRVTGLDVSSEALRMARQNAREAGTEIEWVEGFAERLPFPDKSVDVVVSAHTLEHVRDLHAVAAEFKRVARKRIVILTPRQEFKMYMDNYHTQFFDRKELLIDAFQLARCECREIECGDVTSEFQGKAWFFVGEVDETPGGDR